MRRGTVLQLAFITTWLACGKHEPLEDETSVKTGQAGAPSTAVQASAPSGSGVSTSSVMAVDPSEDYTVTRCSADTPQLNASDFPACDGAIQCPQARCIPADVLAANSGPEIVKILPPCSAGKCAPLGFRGGVSFKPCTGVLGEGRCVPECVALSVMPLGALLFRAGEAGCGRAEVCAPCALGGAPTGLCDTTGC